MNSLKFEGKGFEFFKIHFINVILTVLKFFFPASMGQSPGNQVSV